MDTDSDVLSLNRGRRGAIGVSGRLPRPSVLSVELNPMLVEVLGLRHMTHPRGRTSSSNSILVPVMRVVTSRDGVVSGWCWRQKLNANDVELKIRVRHQECCTRHKSVGLLAAVCYPCHTLLPILLAGSLDGWLA